MHSNHSQLMDQARYDSVPALFTKFEGLSAVSVSFIANSGANFWFHSPHV